MTDIRDEVAAALEDQFDHGVMDDADALLAALAARGLTVVREDAMDAAYRKGWQHGRQAAPRELDLQAAAAAYRAALAARGLTVAREGELDVERLARAIMVAGITDPQDGIPAYRWDLYAGSVAKALAAEYAHLTRQPEGQ